MSQMSEWARQCKGVQTELEKVRSLLKQAATHLASAPSDGNPPYVRGIRQLNELINAFAQLTPDALEMRLGLVIGVLDTVRADVPRQAESIRLGVQALAKARGILNG